VNETKCGLSPFREEVSVDLLVARIPGSVCVIAAVRARVFIGASFVLPAFFLA